MNTQPQTKRQWEVDCPPEYRFGMDGNKWRIYCCAVHFFAEQDYSSISMRKIAQEVGIKAASIYNHFPSKDAILFKMYNHLETVTDHYLPTVEELLLKAESDSPQQVLSNPYAYYPPIVQGLMFKALLATSRMVRSDARASELLHKQLVELPSQYITNMLNHLVDIGRVEPMDVGAFTELFINNYYGSALRQYSGQFVNVEAWQRSFNMLASLIQTIDE